MSSQKPLEDVFDRTLKSSENDEITVDDVARAFGARGFGPFLTLLGLIVVIPPLGAIPGVPVIVAVLILLLSVQIFMGRKYVWLPKFIAKRGIAREKIEIAREKAGPYLRWADNNISERLTWAAGDGSRFVAAIMASLSAILMIMLGIVPFAVAIPGASVLLIGVALFARDGLLMLIAYAIFGSAIYVVLAHSPIGGWVGLG